MTQVHPAGVVSRLRGPMVMSMYLTQADLYADAMAQRREAADTIEAQAKQIEALTLERDEARSGNHAASDYEPTWAQLSSAWKARALAAEAKLLAATKALEPFAMHLDEMKFDLDNQGNELPDEQTVGWVYVTNGHFRTARATLNQIREVK